MPSKMSFFHSALSKKSFTRFSLLWIAYTVVWFFVVPVQMLTYHDEYFSMSYHILTSGIEFGSIINFIYAICVSMALYSYLFSTRSIYTIAALPIQRKTMYCTHYFSGILFCVLPMTFILASGFLINLALGHQVSLELLCLFAMSVLEFLFFFSFGTFCAMLTGHIVMLPALYVILNFTVVVMESIIRTILSSFVFGMGANTVTLEAFSPLVYLLTHCQTETICTVTPTFDTAGVYEYQFHHWNYLLILAAVGILFAAIGFFLYKKRRMEAAGDVIAVKALRPVFKYCFTIGCSCVIGLLIAQILLNRSVELGIYPVQVTICLLLGGFIGYFGAEMLLQKTLRVWKGHWLGFGVFSLCLLCFIFSMEWDIFGYERYVPERENIQSVTLSCSNSEATIENENYISDIVMWHQALVTDKAHQEAMTKADTDVYSWILNINLVYHLENGKSVPREYRLVVNEEEWNNENSIIHQFDSFFNSPEFLLLINEDLFSCGPAQLEYVYISGVDAQENSFDQQLTQEEGYALLQQGIYPDMQAGTIGKEEFYYSEDDEENSCYATIQFSYRTGGQNRYRYKTFTPTIDSQNTLAYLESLGFIPAVSSDFEET